MSMLPDRDEAQMNIANVIVKHSNLTPGEALALVGEAFDVGLTVSYVAESLTVGGVDGLILNVWTHKTFPYTGYRGVPE